MSNTDDRGKFNQSEILRMVEGGSAFESNSEPPPIDEREAKTKRESRPEPFVPSVSPRCANQYQFMSIVKEEKTEREKGRERVRQRWKLSRTSGLDYAVTSRYRSQMCLSVC